MSNAVVQYAWSIEVEIDKVKLRRAVIVAAWLFLSDCFHVTEELLGNNTSGKMRGGSRPRL